MDEFKIIKNTAHANCNFILQQIRNALSEYLSRQKEISGLYIFCYRTAGLMFHHNGKQIGSPIHIEIT